MGSHDEWFINVGGKLRGTDYFLSEQSFNAGRECVEKENAELKRLNTLCPMCGKQTQWGDLVTCLGCAERMDKELREREELQAQLARCDYELRPYFTSSNSIPVERAVIKTELFNRLFNNTTDILDAEILRCASELYSHSQGVVEQGFYIAPLFEAVRARNEAENNENIS